MTRRALKIGDDPSAAALRALAAREKRNRAARRRSAIATALDGMSRAGAAGMERRALRDAVVRCNAEGLDGLHDRPTPGRPPALTEAELALLSARIVRGPDAGADGVRGSASTSWIPAADRGSLRQALAPLSARRLRHAGLSRRKTRPTRPEDRGA